MKNYDCRAASRGSSDRKLSRSGNWVEQDSVDDGKERRVRADSECERQDGDGGEARALAKSAKCKAEILQKFVETATAPLVACDVFDESDVAEFAARGLRGLFRRFAAILAILLR